MSVTAILLWPRRDCLMSLSRSNNKDKAGDGSHPARTRQYKSAQWKSRCRTQLSDFRSASVCENPGEYSQLYSVGGRPPTQLVDSSNTPNFSWGSFSFTLRGGLAALLFSSGKRKRI